MPRRAAPAEKDDVMRVVEGALLETDPERVEDALAAGRVLVAGDPVVGALVTEPHREGAFIDAIAVASSRREEGVGTALVEAAASRWQPLAAEFDAQVRPFYEALGFDVRRDGDRFRGVLR